MVFEIARTETPEDLDGVRLLIRDFFAWAMFHLAEDGKSPNDSIFANIDAELADLPDRFGPPSGCLLLARLNGAPIDCVAFYGQDATTMEIKRMFVRPEVWGKGVGGRILDMLLTEAVAAGYTHYRLSTHYKLHSAQALYRRAGFREVPSSTDFPGIVEGVDICMEMTPGHDAAKENCLA